MKIRSLIVLCIVLAVGFAYAAEEKKMSPDKSMEKHMGKMMTKEQKMKSAMSAAPASVSKDATIMDFPQTEGGEMVKLKDGTNGWTCMPDDPHTPANDPMCLDKAGLEWGMAWMSHKEPNITTGGMGYMLMGGGSPSNTDPFAMAPKQGETYLKEPPHIMLFFPGGKIDETVYGTDPNSGKPWIMFRGTPYAHLMVPVK